MLGGAARITHGPAHKFQPDHVPWFGWKPSGRGFPDTSCWLRELGGMLSQDGIPPIPGPAGPLFPAHSIILCPSAQKPCVGVGANRVNQPETGPFNGSSFQALPWAARGRADRG